MYIFLGIHFYLMPDNSKNNFVFLKHITLFKIYSLKDSYTNFMHLGKMQLNVLILLINIFKYIYKGPER